MSERLPNSAVNRTNAEEVIQLLKEIVDCQSWDGGNHLSKPASLNHSQATRARMLVQRILLPDMEKDLGKEVCQECGGTGGVDILQSLNRTPNDHPI